MGMERACLHFGLAHRQRRLPQRRLGTALSRIIRLVCALLLSWGAAYASDRVSIPNTVTIEVFWSASCPHCKKALRFVDELKTEQPDIRVISRDIGEPSNLKKFETAVARFGIAQPGVPLIVIGSRVQVGYADDATTGQHLRALAALCQAGNCGDPATTSPSALKPEAPHALRAGSIRSVSFPLLGNIELRQLSLPALTVVLAAADGFNPCAMWVLLFLLGLLVGVENRWRRFLLGGAFIVVSAFVYYLIMAAWLNTLLFLGMVVWIRMAIGVVALGVGSWSLREFFVNPENLCKVTASPARRAVLDRLKIFALSPSLLVALAGIVLLAFAVNVVELLCSAGIPATYTQVLALNNLPAWQYHAFLALYVMVFMLDDLLVFIGAMLAMELTGLGTNYARWANLIGGMILIALGVLMIAKPEWLI